MDHHYIIEELAKNQLVFTALLSGVGEAQYTWKIQENSWCLLEMLGHLCDEEVEDFRARVKHVLVKHVLESPHEPMTPIDPVAWVTERDYMGQDYDQQLARWQRERQASVSWLRSLTEPRWENVYEHPSLGPLSAQLFLANWLEHDYLHIRQINRIKHQYLETHTGVDLSYAGGW